MRGGFMQDIITVLKEKNMLIPGLLLKNYRHLNITEKELVILIYYLNQTEMVYNPEAVSNYLNFKTAEVMEIVASLQNKNVITIDVCNEKGKHAEYVNIDNLYHKIGLIFTEKVGDEKKNVFAVFEEEFGRTLSPTEYEIIAAWQEQKIPDELILTALKEAVYNGVRSLRYIDAILNDWQKKGYKKVSDIKKEVKRTKVDQTLFEYDWLNENE